MIDKVHDRSVRTIRNFLQLDRWSSASDRLIDTRLIVAKWLSPKHRVLAVHLIMLCPTDDFISNNVITSNRVSLIFTKPVVDSSAYLSHKYFIITVYSLHSHNLFKFPSTYIKAVKISKIEHSRNRQLCRSVCAI